MFINVHPSQYFVHLHTCGSECFLNFWWFQIPDLGEKYSNHHYEMKVILAECGKDGHILPQHHCPFLPDFIREGSVFS